MKKLLLVIVVLMSTFLANAQINIVEKAEALHLINANKVALNLSDDDLNNTIVFSTYKNKFAGTTMVYLQQTYLDIPIYNQVQTLAFKNGKLVSIAGELIKNVGDFANVKSKIPIVKSDVAVMLAITDRKLNTKETANAIASYDAGRKFEFGKMGVSRENITASLMWFPSEIGKKTLKLGWQIYIIQNNSADYWLINVDATDKSIISVGNLTNYCNWDDPLHKNDHKHDYNNIKDNVIAENNNLFDFTVKLPSQENRNTSPSIVNTVNYRVVPYPAESPIHPGGTPALVTNPWDLSGAGNPATVLKWHSVGATNYDITRGNNVWAQEDQNNNNGTSATQVTSTTTPDPLNFDFVPDFNVIPTQTTPASNQQFNTTNLFYWNNIIHDLTYQYGFDEAARNFQADNLGKGGIGGDYVFADAQDGGGTNNANFSTPADGGNGRMQMYIWTAANPDRDGDVDNGIIAHEFAHGISNRLTGTGSGCLGNAEQMGEGWSDYYGLMYTQNWATSTLASGFNSPRGIGTYALNQPITGNGIRSQRYTTNFAINNKVYAASIPSQQHDRGEIWCATLWDMTWGIINQVGSINSNLFNAAGTGGNSIALKLVTEGMKLQPCSPGFISGRDAILQADMILYGGAYRCTILEAFRRRGMGLGASQGSSASVTDQIPSFVNGGAAIVLLQNGTTAVPEGQNINYINRVTADACTPFVNYTITDTLPTNVTYVSGGSYNAANRVVSFTVNQAAGTTGDYNFVVNINAGTYFAPTILISEPVPATMPATWIATTTVPAAGNLWSISTLQSNSAPNSFFSLNETISTDKRLELTSAIPLPTSASAYIKLDFWHKYNTEDGWDGGVVEISTNGGATWADLGANMLTNAYNSSLGAGTGNNLSNRAAYTGSIPNFINTSVNLTAFAGQSVKIRFRFASDDNTAGTGTPTGWFVDDINITNTATVSMRSSFFNAAMVRVNTSDTSTLILLGSVTPPVITTQPPNTSVCSGNNATFTASITGAGITYNWQVSTDGGVNWNTTIPAANTNTITLNAVTTSMNNYRYRVVATNSMGSVTTNGLATLTVSATPLSPAITSPVLYCQGATAVALTATGTNLLWYTTASGGPAGTATAPTPITTTVGNTIYYVSQTVGICESPRAAITVTINATPLLPTVITPINYCQGTTATALSATGTNLKWYTVSTGGIALAGAPTPSTTALGSTIYYVSQTSGICEGPRAAITVIVAAVSPMPIVSSTPIAYCPNTTAIPLTATGINLLWYTSITGGVGTAITPTPSTTTAGSTVYYVTQNSTCGESPRAAITVVVNSTPAAPIANAISYCQGNTATALTATGANLLWYAGVTGGVGTITAPTPITTTAGTTNYYVSQSVLTCESSRTLVVVTVTSAPVITIQPQDVTSCNPSATFNVTATGTGLTYQWYVSTNGGGSYNVIPGATLSSLVLTGLTSLQASYKYRVVVSSGSCIAVTSNSVSASVAITPVVVLTTAPTTNFNPYTNGGIYTTVSPVGNYTYQWKRNSNILTNSGTFITKANGLLDEFGSYFVSVTDVVTGCVGLSNTVTVSDMEDARGQLFISPNPTTGLFSVSYYNSATAAQSLSVDVYNEAGAKVLVKNIVLVGRYGNANIDLSKFANGTYIIILRDATGKKLAKNKVVKY
ncbi:MAG: M36 family metallopeptidase [Ferruginibacter sp.]|nr:T9SS type A sorting domain-containing protein [Ferruginibacter sp.]